MAIRLDTRDADFEARFAAFLTTKREVSPDVDAAVRMLQAALGTVQDGIIGRQTLSLAQASTPWHQARYLAARAQRYMGTRGFDRFGQGWLIRVFLLARDAA